MPQAPYLGRKVSQLRFEGCDIGRVDDVGQRSLDPRNARILRLLGRLVLSGGDRRGLPSNTGNGCLKCRNLSLKRRHLGALGSRTVFIG
jgi:hypothetical protein